MCAAGYLHNLSFPTHIPSHKHIHHTVTLSLNLSGRDQQLLAQEEALSGLRTNWIVCDYRGIMLSLPLRSKDKIIAANGIRELSMRGRVPLGNTYLHERGTVVQWLLCGRKADSSAPDNAVAIFRPWGL